MTNGSGSAGFMKEDFFLYERLRDLQAMHALQDYPINVGARSMHAFLRRYDYRECKEQVEAWVLSELKHVARMEWKNAHPVLEADKLPNNDLSDSGKQASRRRLRASLRLAQMLARAYSHRPASRNRALARNAGSYAPAVSCAPRQRPSER